MQVLYKDYQDTHELFNNEIMFAHIKPYQCVFLFEYQTKKKTKRIINA